MLVANEDVVATLTAEIDELKKKIAELEETIRLNDEEVKVRASMRCAI